jgi:hypothetical protein
MPDSQSSTPSAGGNASWVPPLWILVPALKGAFLWIASNQFGQQEDEAERLWPIVFMEQRSQPTNWRLHLPQRLQSHRIGDGRMSSWDHLNSLDWTDGTVRTPTWSRFQDMWVDRGPAAGGQIVGTWGLRSWRDNLDLRAVFGKQHGLEGSRDDLRNLLGLELKRQSAMQPLQPPRVIVEHEPVTVTVRGEVGLTIGAEMAGQTESQANRKGSPLYIPVVKRLREEYQAGRHHAPGDLRRFMTKTVIPQEQAKYRETHGGVSAKVPGSERQLERWVRDAK